MKKQILWTHAVTLLFSIFLTSFLSPVRAAAPKLHFQYIVFPTSVFVSIVGDPPNITQLNVCLVNQGAAGQLIYDETTNMDHATVTIPRGSNADDLIETGTVPICSYDLGTGWECDIDASGADILLTIHPDPLVNSGVVDIGVGETICFRVEGVTVNTEVGLVILEIDQQFDAGRADKSKNGTTGVFKTETSSSTIVEIDPTVAESVKDGVDWTEVSGIPGDIADGDHVNDGDISPTNELNTSVGLNGTNLDITDAGGTISANLSSLINDADADPTNELQTLSTDATTITLSGGGGTVTAPYATNAGNAEKLDNKDSSEFLDTSANSQTKTGSLNINGTVTATAFIGDGSGLTGVASAEDCIPSGGIIMWSGALANIPEGWALCDGTNGTPDLRDRFVVGAAPMTDPGATGGASSYNLSVNQLPSHTHSGSASSSSAGNHSHTGSATSSGGHTHRIFSSNGDQRDPKILTLSREWCYVQGYGVEVSLPPDGRGILSAGSHSHSISTNSIGSHSHSFSFSIGATGSSDPIDNRPAYYALAFIMKL